MQCRTSGSAAANDVVNQRITEYWGIDMRVVVPGIILSAALLGVVACGSSTDTSTATTTVSTTAEQTGTSAAPDAGGTATVTLAPAPGGSVSGQLTVAPSADGVLVSGTIEGLEPNTQHGFHIHEFGDCSAPDFAGAGGHFNPTGQPHGQAGMGEHHAGDANNVVADADGVATVDADFVGVTLGDGGPEDVLGRAVVVHADPDDYVSQPAGNAGGRIACGVITEG